MLLALLSACVDGASEKADTAPTDTNVGAPVLAVSPASIAFGGVYAGEAASELVTVENRGDEALQIEDLRLLDDVPGLSVSAIAAVLLPPSMHTTFTVTYDPTAPGSWATAVRIDTNDPTTPTFELPVSGEGYVADLRVETPETDLGAVDVGCEAATVLVLTSVGSADVVVSDLSLDAPGEGWSLDTSAMGTLPWTLSPGTSVVLPVHFAPDGPGVDTAALTVTSDDPDGTTTIALTASGAYAGEVLETFVQTNNRADYVFAVDTSSSMAEEVERLASSMGTFVDALDAAGLDYRVAVAAGVNGCNAGGYALVEPGMARDDRVVALEDMLAQAQSVWEEAGFTLLAEALAPANVAVGGCNEGLLRPGASLDLVGVTDEIEQSSDPYLAFVADFQALLVDPDLLRVHAIAGDYPTGCEGVSAGLGWYEATVLTDGVFASVCATSYDTALTSMVTARPLLTRFELSAWPLVDTFVVRVDGLEQPDGWWYADADNALVFDEAPPADALVEVVYAVAGECD